MAACQGMDRLEPDRIIEVESGAEGSVRGTVLDGSDARARGPLTTDVYLRRLREIEAASGEERIRRAEEFWREYPEGDFASEVHELVGDAYSALGRPEDAARAWQRAIETSWPAPDILRLPLTNLQLPYEVGWAHYEAGEPALGADWLVRAGFISDRPQLEQGLRFLYAELGSPEPSFEGWRAARRADLAVPAPDFELPGYQADSLRFSEVATEVTLINFWTPT